MRWLYRRIAAVSPENPDSDRELSGPDFTCPESVRGKAGGYGSAFIECIEARPGLAQQP